MKHKFQWEWIAVIGLSAIFIGFIFIPKIFTGHELAFQLVAACLGALITMFITRMLLNDQTKSSEQLETNVKIFERKQEVYHTFIQKVQDIVRDGEVTINEQTDELKDLIFQLGYLQMHASKETMDKVLTGLSDLILKMNDFYAYPNTQRQKEMANFYAGFSQELFKIVAALKQDLYGGDCKPVEAIKMSAILKNCGLFVQTGEVNWPEMQLYFWTEIQKKLENLGHKFNIVDLTSNVKRYYTKSRTRYRGLGFSIPIHTSASGKTVIMKIEVNDNLFYGIQYEYSKNVSEAKDDALTQVVSQCGSGYFFNSPRFAGWKHPDFCGINFWKREATNFGDLNNLRHWDRAIEQIAENINKDIKIFQAKAKELGL